MKAIIIFQIMGSLLFFSDTKTDSICRQQIKKFMVSQTRDTVYKQLTHKLDSATVQLKKQRAELKMMRSFK